SVGESKEAMWEATASIASLLPEEKPRYFMGLGDPRDVIDAIARGVDMFDCVAPSRLARHGSTWRVATSDDLATAFWQADLETILQAGDESLKIERVNLLNNRFATDV